MNTQNDPLSDYIKSLILQVIATQKELENREKESSSAPPPKNDVLTLETLNAKEVSKLLNCTIGTVWNYCTKGKLIKHKIGNKVFFLKKEVLEALKIK